MGHNRLESQRIPSPCTPDRTEMGRPLSSKEMAALYRRASGHFVTARDLRRYAELHTGIHHHMEHWHEEFGGLATQPTPPDETLAGLDLSPAGLPTLDSGRVMLTLLKDRFRGVPLTRMRRKPSSEGGDLEPTGTENLVFFEGTKLAEATHVWKVPLLQPTDKVATRQTELTQNIYSHLAPGQILPIRGEWINDPFNASGELYLYRMPKIDKHPEFDAAEKESRAGNPEPLQNLITTPFFQVLKSFQIHQMPLDLDPPQRNFIVTPDGVEAFIELLWVEPRDVLNPWTKVQLYGAVEEILQGASESHAQESVGQLISMLNEMQQLENQKQPA
jgi:hypothetical protein